MKIIHLFLIVLLLSCVPKVEDKDRDEYDFTFTSAMMMNYSEVNKSYRTTGSVSDGINTIPLFGRIIITKNRVTVQFDEREDNGDFKGMIESGSIDNVFKEGEDKFLYKTEIGEYTVMINENDEVFCIVYNDYRDYISFNK